MTIAVSYARTMRPLLQAWIILFMVAVPVFGQDNVDGFIGKTHRSRTGSMPYRLFVPPGYDKTKQYPLVIWLHGGGSAGDDNLGQISRDNRLGTHFWTQKDKQERHPAFVLAPQSLGGWDNAGTASLSPELQLVLEILEDVRREYSIDADRLYIAGQSNGGIGAWGLITKRPGLFAAAIPLCGAGNPEIASRAAKTAVWAFHGEIDDVIESVNSRNMINAMKRAGGKPRYTEYKGVGHEIWERVFREPELEEWLFSQHR